MTFLQGSGYGLGEKKSDPDPEHWFKPRNGRQVKRQIEWEVGKKETKDNVANPVLNLLAGSKFVV